jgi:hypothetical protein
LLAAGRAAYESSMRDERLRGVAERLQLREIRCPLCINGRTLGGQRCAKCDGTGRLWSKIGVFTLTDRRLKRLA